MTRITTTTVTVTILLLLLSGGLSAQNSITLGTVEGLIGGQIPVAASEVTINLHLTNGEGFPIRGMSNGIQVYGSDNAVTWNIIDYGPTPELIIFFSDIMIVIPPEWHGVGADTIGFSAYSFLSAGIPEGYDGDYFWLTVSLTDEASIGHDFCLDSAFYPPSGIWMWDYGAMVGMRIPSWDGPHCFEIASCCQGYRGNVDFDPEDNWDIADLVYLVDYMFVGGAVPPCFEEADIQPDGQIDISDLVALVDAMFTTMLPPDCN